MSSFQISEGVADQLQTNYASDLRSILKTLFEVMATKSDQGDNEKPKKGQCASEDTETITACFHRLMSDIISLMCCLICTSGPCLGSAVLEDCALCQETISSSELAAKAREGQFEG